MTLLAAAGWFVVHTLWLSSLAAGAAAVAAALIGDHRVRLRCTAAYVGLTVMCVAPIVLVLMGDDLLSPNGRRTLMTIVGSRVPLPQLLDWRTLLLPLIGGVWAAWCAFAAWRVIGEWRRVRRLLRGPLRAVDGTVENDVHALREMLQIRTRVRVCESIAAEVPMVLGVQSATILLPPAAVAAMSAEERRAILCHELAHVRRRDLLLNAVQIAMETVLCHHPAATWLSARVRADREYCCDDIAIHTTGDAGLYAHALVGLDDARSDNRLVVAASSGTLLHRISRIAGRPRREVPLARAAAMCAAAAVMAALVFSVTMTLPPHLPRGTKMRSARAEAPNAAALAGATLPKRSSR